jgi:hypothetical protein
MTERRLHQAEQVVRTLAERRDPQEPLDPLEAHLYRLCCPLGLLGGVRAVAEERAIRRAMLEDRIDGWSGRPPDWDARVQAERDALPAFLDAVAAADVMDALEAWADVPDREGWPAPHSFSSRPEPTGTALFRQRMAQTRKLADSHRRQDRPGAIAWRAEHPGWRDGMGDAEMLRWELDVLALISQEGGDDPT